MRCARGWKWAVWMVVMMVLTGSCASDPLPLVLDEETSSGSTSSGSTSSASTSSASTGSSEAGLESECGDGIVEAGESCDANEIVVETCEGLGFGVGVLTCNDECGYETSECTPAMPTLSLSFSQVKRFDFTWAASQGAEYYQMFESPAPGDPYVQLGEDIAEESVSFEMPLYLRWQASYVLRACSASGCTDSAAVDVVGSLAEAVGYVKASNAELFDNFGGSVGISGDGNTLAVGAWGEDGGWPSYAEGSGAVYVFVRDSPGSWSQQAYIKASNLDTSDSFGCSVALSEDGDTLAVGAGREDGSWPSYAENSGAVYVFVRDGVGAWSQQAYVKASNPDSHDYFGFSLALSGDGNTLAVGAWREDGNWPSYAEDSGAVYVFVRDNPESWSQQAYIKASNLGSGDSFGSSLAISGDGNTLAIGAPQESSNATGVGGDQANNGAEDSGAVYVFVRNEASSWSQQAYVKASNTDSYDYFGFSLALSGDGDTLAVGAPYEGSNATGIGGNQDDDDAEDSGAVYVFVRNEASLWAQRAYVKASNTHSYDYFGFSLVFSGDGNTLAISAPNESNNAVGIGGIQNGFSLEASGAAYVFVRDGAGIWSQQAYVKASDASVLAYFGIGLALSGDGNILALGAHAVRNVLDLDDLGIVPVDGTGAVYLY